MRYDVAVGQTGARSGIPHPSAHLQSPPAVTRHRRALSSDPDAPRPSSPKAARSPITNHQALITSHDLALSVTDCLLLPDGSRREGSPTRPERSRMSFASRRFASGRITAFLIVTPAIRNESNSFPFNKCARSNRHSPAAHFGASNSIRALVQKAESPKLLREEMANGRNLISSTSSTSSTSFPSLTSSTSFASHFASQTTRPELPCLLADLLCYSFLVTRVPPNGLRASAPARSHGCGVDVSLPCNVRSTGAFPHKFTNSTGLIGPADFVLRDRPCNPFGFRSPGCPMGDAGVKEKPCES
jgi:hypothetical protein